MLESEQNWSMEPPENYVGMQREEDARVVCWDLGTEVLFMVKEEGWWLDAIELEIKFLHRPWMHWTGPLKGLNRAFAALIKASSLNAI